VRNERSRVVRQRAERSPGLLQGVGKVPVFRPGRYRVLQHLSRLFKVLARQSVLVQTCFFGFVDHFHVPAAELLDHTIMSDRAPREVGFRDGLAMSLLTASSAGTSIKFSAFFSCASRGTIRAVVRHRVHKSAGETRSGGSGPTAMPGHNVLDSAPKFGFHGNLPATLSARINCSQQAHFAPGADASCPV
jgi:hypothetical protein